MELKRRYGTVHARFKTILDLYSPPPPMAVGHRTGFALAMPEQYRRDDAVEAYRAYYIGEKLRFATWRAPAVPPYWIQIIADNPR